MPEDHTQADHQHSSPIQTPKQLITIVVLAFVIPIGAIILLSQLATSGLIGAESSNAAALEARIAPIGVVAVSDPNTPKVLQTGEQVFGSVCKTCHEAGLAGAPKVGDKAAWSARIAQGDATLYKHALLGYTGKSGMMPAKGGNTDLADVEVERAVVYMVNQSGGNFKEPPAPASAAPAATTATAPATVTTAAAPVAAPVATAVATATATAAPAAAAKPDGKPVYTATCALCHGPGIAGAPKFGDKALWAPRIAEGNPTLYQHAIKGFQGKAGVMPPKGGNATLSDDAVKAAVDYMVAAAK